nr:MLO-related protein [Tanacetum cinerariifolium]
MPLRWQHSSGLWVLVQLWCSYSTAPLNVIVTLVFSCLQHFLTRFLRRMMNDRILRGLKLVKTERIRIIEIFVYRLTLKVACGPPQFSQQRQTELEVDNRNHSEHRSHITHKHTSRTGVVEDFVNYQQ